MSDISSQPLLALIQSRGLLDDMQLDEVLQEYKRSGKPIGQILQDFSMLDSDTQLQIIADHLGTEVVSISDSDITQEVVEAIPAETARMYQCMPVALFGSTVRVVLADPLNPSTLDELGFTVSREIQLAVADPVAIEKAIQKHYGQESGSVSDILKELGADSDIARNAFGWPSQWPQGLPPRVESPD